MTGKCPPGTDQPVEIDNEQPVEASAAIRALAACLFLLEGLLFLGSLLLSLASMFAFDAPGAAFDPRTWLVVAGAWIAPVVFAFGARNAWLAMIRLDRLSAKVALLAPAMMLSYLGLLALMMKR